MHSESSVKINQGATLAIFIGWFFLDTLAVTIGSLQHSVRFFDLCAAMGEPRRILFGVESWVQRIAFGSLCLACLAAPLLARQCHGHIERWVSLAPLGLMIGCGVLLYCKTSADTFAVPNDLGSLGHGVMRLANSLARQGATLVSRHISLGLGAYVALVGALVLAIDGWRRR